MPWKGMISGLRTKPKQQKPQSSLFKAAWVHHGRLQGDGFSDNNCLWLGKKVKFSPLEQFYKAPGQTDTLPYRTDSCAWFLSSPRTPHLGAAGKYLSHKPFPASQRKRNAGLEETGLHCKFLWYPFNEGEFTTRIFLGGNNALGKFPGLDIRLCSNTAHSCKVGGLGRLVFKFSDRNTHNPRQNSDLTHTLPANQNLPRCQGLNKEKPKSHIKFSQKSWTLKKLNFSWAQNTGLGFTPEPTASFKTKSECWNLTFCFSFHSYAFFHDPPTTGAHASVNARFCSISYLTLNEQ